jgi:hypothetical protein
LRAICAGSFALMLSTSKSDIAMSTIDIMHGRIHDNGSSYSSFRTSFLLLDTFSATDPQNNTHLHIAITNECESESQLAKLQLWCNCA